MAAAAVVRARLARGEDVVAQERVGERALARAPRRDDLSALENVTVKDIPRSPVGEDMRPLLLALVLALPGCLGTDPPGEAATRTGPLPPTRVACPDVGMTTADAPAGCAASAVANGTPAPTLPVGRAWTYQARQTYSPDPEFTVVVAEAGPDGYLFAGGAEDDLVYHALWGSEWHGRHTLDLGIPGWDMVPIRFPLVDGLEWDLTERLRVKARAAQVQTPLGTMPGFVVEGQDERVTVRYEYADAVGYYVSLLVEIDGRVHEELKLTRMEEGRSDWVWFERGDLAVVPNPHEPAAFEVPEGFDNVLVSAGGTRGARATVAPPPGGPAPWQTEFTDEAQAWHHAVLPPTPGRWTATVQGRPFLDAVPVEPPAQPPVGWAYAHAAPVKWVRHMA